MESIEVKLNAALTKIAALETENKQLKEAVAQGRIEKAKAERAVALKEAKLPAPCVARLDEAFKSSTDNAGLKEAINVEAEYVKSLQGEAKKNNGAGDNGNLQESTIESLQERQYNSYRKSGMSETEASAMSGFTPKK